MVKKENTGYKVVHLQADNHFEVDLGKEKAILIYMIRAELFVLLHTEVPPAFEGRGIAGMLAKAALEYAKKEGLKVRSYCSYTTFYIEKHPEYRICWGERLFISHKGSPIRTVRL